MLRGHRLQLPLIKQLSPRSEKAAALLPAPREPTILKADTFETKANRTDRALHHCGQIDIVLYDEQAVAKDHRGQRAAPASASGRPR